MTQARMQGHYPAPLAAISVIEHGLGQPVATGFQHEEDAVSDLAIGPVCKNLIRIFLLSEHAKKAAVVDDPNVTPQPIRLMALAGAGIMGGGIAELASRSGIEVRMRDLQPAALTRALQTTRGLIDERLRRRRGPAGVQARERDAQMARITPTLDLTGFGRADFVMEAVVEDLDVKRRVFGEIEVRVRPDAVLATNTSSLSVDALAGGLVRPEQLCGFHFFNPVHRMPLVEVIRGEKSSDETIATIFDLARKMGKTPVVVRDAPGFLVNRILAPYLSEAVRLLEEGCRIEQVDSVMTNFGMPVGPLALLDDVGIDVAAKGGATLAEAFPERLPVAGNFEILLHQGRLGRKTGRGFYRYRGTKREKPDPEGIVAVPKGAAPADLHPPEVIEARLLMPMINEAAFCLEDGIVAEPSKVDLAMIFGTGFPPFRGGLLKYADDLGIDRVVNRLEDLAERLGARFSPSPLLRTMAESRKTFYPRS